MSLLAAEEKNLPGNKITILNKADEINLLIYFRNRMIGGGRHMASRRRGSSPMIRGLEVPEASPKTGATTVSPRRRRAVAVADHKSCALIQTRLKLGELV